MRIENNNTSSNFFIRDEMNDMTHLLDGIIEQRSDLGELGKELELILRIAGVKAITDPELSNRYH